MSLMICYNYFAINYCHCYNSNVRMILLILYFITHSWSCVILEKLLKNSQNYMEPEYSLPFSREPYTETV